MNQNNNKGSVNRRDFIKIMATAAASGPALISAACANAPAVSETAPAERQHPMPLKQLGRTGFMSSRLVFGCGAALMWGKSSRLLERAFAAGINHYDVGMDDYYKGSEKNLSPFINKHRDKVFLVSKAMPLPFATMPGELDKETAEYAASFWITQLESSLRNLKVDHVDAYYLMGVDNPALIRSEALYNAFQKAKQAGKVRFYGFSAHKNTQDVLAAAIDTGWYDLAMIGITPAGWYNWNDKGIEKDTLPLVQLQDLLKKGREAGIGLIAMKAARYIASLGAYGSGDAGAFDRFYDKPLLLSPLNPFQRSYAYVLQHGLDVVNADMQNFKHLEENIAAVATGEQYFS